MLGGADNPNGELPSYITGADTLLKSMNSQAVSSARSPLSASIQNSNWLPTLYSSNDLMKSPSMQGCWINPLF